MAGAFAPAWGAEVVSSNIVGYNKVTLTSGYNLLGANWNLVGGQDGSLTEVMDATKLPGLDVDTEKFGATVQVWNGAGYTSYGWSGEVGDADLDNTWLTLSWDAANVDAAKGTAFWLNSTTASEVTFSGEVASEDSITVDVAAGYNLIANPFPETISIQDIDAASLSPLNVDTEKFGATIQIWNGSGYSTYGWSGEVGDADLNNKWLTLSWDVATATIDIGTGFWINSDKAGTVVFSK